MKPHVLDATGTLTFAPSGIKLIEASAGTGKTYAIGNLYLRLICESRRVSEVLVVTFTIAATEELRGRIRLRLSQALQQLQGCSDSDDFLRQWASNIHDSAPIIMRLKRALRSMDEAAVYTINGFCQRALGDFAFNSQQPFETEMVADDTYLWEQAMQDWWRINGYPLEAHAVGLFTHALGDIDQLTKLQKPLRGTTLRLIPEVTQSMDVCYQAWQRLAESWYDLSQQWKKRSQELLVILQDSKALGRAVKTYNAENLKDWETLWQDYFDGTQWWLWPSCLSMLATDTLQKLSTPKKRGSDPALDDVFFHGVQEWLDAALTISQQFRIAALHDSNAYAFVQVNRVKRDEGLMSFHDQLQRLADGLLRNPALAVALRKRFPIAMIDEFQDTDALQYTIFHTIYREAQGLIMIGDPKQAIYGFRGGDIFTYIDAAKHAEERWTLDSNWRSTTAMVDAVNAIFSQPESDAFLFSGIDFEPVKAANRSVPLLKRHNVVCPAIHMWLLPDQGKGKSQSKKQAEPVVFAQTANEIASLLQEAARGEALLGSKPVCAGDIAVLVRTHDEAEGLRRALQKCHVAAVINAKTHVFLSEESQGLRLLLEAIVSPQEHGLLHQALASSLLGYDYASIANTSLNEDCWLDWCEEIQFLHQQWQNHGFMAMFQHLLHRLNIAEVLASKTLAERRLTNLLHVGELLQQASRTRPSMAGLLDWFTQQNNANGEESELRLESDAERVRIVTIYASKGLEYPIVFLPTLWQCPHITDKNDALTFYDSSTQGRVHDVGSTDWKKHLELAEKEGLAEDIRLVYVALTRASSHMVIVWGHVGSNQKYTGMNWLLHRSEAASPSTMKDDLTRLCEQSNDDIKCIDITMDMPSIIHAPMVNQTMVQCEAQQLTKQIKRQFRILSFSALTRDLPHPPFNRVLSEDSILTFKAGKQTGVFLHGLLETLDFQGDVQAKTTLFCEQYAVRHGLPADCAEVIAPWIQQVVTTPLGDDGFTLSDIAANKRLNELAFDYPLATLRVGHLDALLQNYMGCYLPPLTAAYYQGFMTGVIDLVFEHQGRYYIADYKGNALGSSLADYHPDVLRYAVCERRYDLQYLIYTLALHRYLTLRLPDYDYDQHFGGVYYLFLRGMRETHEIKSGVYLDRLPLELLENCKT